jgi:hypothetical protein
MTPKPLKPGPPLVADSVPEAAQGTRQADQMRGRAAAQTAAVTPLLHNYREARALLGGVPTSTFAYWIAQGLLTPVRIGPRRCFIRHEDIVRLTQGADLPRGA